MTIDSGDEFLAFLTSPWEPPAPVPSDARMVRVVCAERVDQDAMDRDVLVIDLGVDGHGDPFHPGDLVIQDPGLTGLRVVVDIQLYPDARTQLGLVVRPVAMLLDPESAPPPETRDESDDEEAF
jgi:hypothetical protein